MSILRMRGEKCSIFKCYTWQLLGSPLLEYQERQKTTKNDKNWRKNIAGVKTREKAN